MSMDFSNLYKIDKNDKVFIDTNILIFLFSPDFVNSQEYQVEQYANIYGKLIENECELFINSHVVSEFINKCLRIDFEKNFQDRDRSKDFKKDYRTSSRYEQSLNLILKELKKFTNKNVKQISDNFENFIIFNEYKNHHKSDFNDLIIAKNVIDNNLKLLSDDGDFDVYEKIDTNWYIK